MIFGASGDLTKRKLLPAFWHLWLQRRLPKGFALVGYARSAITSEEFRQSAFDDITKFAKHPPEGEDWEEFARRLSYHQGEISEPGAMNDFVAYLEKIDAEFGTEGRRVFDAAVPPTVYADIVRRIGRPVCIGTRRSCWRSRSGSNCRAARELDRGHPLCLRETQVFRTTTTSARRTVQNILAFRFANGMFEPIWNRRYIDHVQITVAEKIGIEGRGPFYEQVGNIRDMISTHLFQVMTFVAMEPPVSFAPDRLRDETVKALRSTDISSLDRVIRGQYVGYRDEQGVAPDSTMETFSAMELDIDNWRWAGVPVLPADRQGAGREVQRDHPEVQEGAVQRVPRVRHGPADARPPHRPRAAERGHHDRVQRQTAGTRDACG